MSARAVAVIRPAANIIPRLAFLYILSGQGQLHAFQYKSHCDPKALWLFWSTHSPAAARYVMWEMGRIPAIM